MKSIAGAAFLAAIVLGATFAVAEAPYGVGGYLERPYVPDDDEAGVAAAENSAAEAARRRRERAATPTEAAPPAQSAGASQQQSQAAPATTSATQGEPRRPSPQTAQRQRPAAPGISDNNIPNATVPNYQEQAQPRRPVRANQGDAASPSAQQQRDNAASSRPASSTGEQRRPRIQTQDARDQASNGMEIAIPPLPLRRPKFADAPARPVVTAIAEPAPTAEEAAPSVAPAGGAQRTELAEQPASQEPQQTPAEGQPPQAEQAATPPSPAPTERPVDAAARPSAQVEPETQPDTASEAAAATVLSVQITPQAGEPAEPGENPQSAAETQPERRAEPLPESAGPSKDIAALSPESPALPEASPAGMSSAALATDGSQPAAEAVAPEPADPLPAEADRAMPFEVTKAPQQGQAEAPADGEPTIAAPALPSSHPDAQDAASQSQADAVRPAEPVAASEAQPVAPQPAAAQPAMPAAAPVAAPAPAIVPGVAPPVADVVPDLPARLTRMATAGDAATAVPQPPIRQAAGLDKIIGQMLVVGFRGLTPEESWPQKLAAQIKAGTVGGVLFMSHNVQSPQQLKTLTASLQKAKGEIPLLFAVDQEGGIVQRLSAEKGFQDYPTAGKIGRSNDPLTAYSVYRRLAAELSEYGFNLNLGPVVDLLRSDASPIIAGKERSFGSQPKHVAAFAKAFCIAHQDEGVLTVLKHFPGHGSTPFDTHVQPVNVGATWTEDEVVPYRELIASRTAHAVMMGHIANPAMADEPGLPASLSAKAIRQVLRGEFGFNGIVISDDLEMGAIRARYSLAESAVKAIKAGNDIIILSNQNAPNPDLPERITAAIKRAVETGELRAQDLQASYDRILGFKQRLPGAVSPAATSGAAGVKPGASTKRASSDRDGRSASTRQ